MRYGSIAASLSYLACACGVAVLTCSVSAQVPAEGESPQVIKVFSLANAAAPEVSEVVDAVFGDTVVAIAADKRTNSLVVKGRAEAVAALEAVLMKLDGQPQRHAPLRPKAAATRPREKTSPPLPRVAPSKRGDKPSRRIDFRSQLRGTGVITKLIPNGTRVKKGDLLVELDDAPLNEDLQKLKIEIEELKAGDIVVAEQQIAADHSDAVETSEMELRIAELQLKQVEAELGLEQIIAEGELSLAKKTLEILDTRQQSLKQLVAVGTASSEQMQQIHEVAVQIAETKTKLEVAAAKRKLLNEFVRPLKLAEAEFGLMRARADVKRAKREGAQNSAQSRAKLHALRRQLELKTDQLEFVEKQIANCRIFAPHSGMAVIPNPTLIKAGAVVRRGQSLGYLEVAADSPR